MAQSVFPQASSGSAYTAGTTFGATAGRPASPTVGQTYYNGTTSTFEIWNGSVWSAINSIPSTVTSVTATDQGTGRVYNNGQTSVAFTPATVGGAATSFLVTSSPGGYTASGSASPIVVTGLQSNTSYTYSVVASNNLGAAAALVSSAVTATTLPSAAGTPTATSVADGTGNISLSWTAANTGGITTSYVATSSPGGITSTSSASTSATMTGLTSGTAYTFTVVASNANGSAAASAASNSVTSLAGPTFTNYLVVAGGASTHAPQSGGGGGGAVKTGSTFSPGASWTVTVGAAGTASNTGTAGSKTDAQGRNSVMASITCQGGGTGGYGASAGLYNGTAGGNGGGAYHYATEGTASGGGSTDNGNSGGSATGNNSYYSKTAAGGGAGGAGSDMNAGAGVENSLTGTSIYYGPGGAGGVYTTSGTYVTNGAPRNSSAPTANNGAGAGAWNGSGSPTSGSAGIVVIKYPTTFRAITTISGLTYTVSSAGGYYTYIFTGGSGTCTW